VPAISWRPHSASSVTALDKPARAGRQAHLHCRDAEAARATLAELAEAVTWNTADPCPQAATVLTYW